jgi:hypothetical protein
MIMNDKVQAVNDLLRAGEPGNISVDEHSDYTGYAPQSVIDAMNEVFYGEWGFDEYSNEIVAGDKGGLAVAKVGVWLKDNDSKPTAWGQNRVTRGDVGDAHKGAQTDAIKKALSYFSIGNRAYLGLLPNKQEQASAARSQPRQHPTTERPTAPAQEGQSEAVKQMIHKASERAKGIGITTKETWSAFILETLKEQKPTHQWTLNDVSRINGELTRREKQPANV